MQNNLTKRDIRNKIENLEKYFSKYKNQDASKKLEEIKQKLNEKEYKIAVVANMSAGKSTFINALFGKVVLPTNSEATTDSATYIYSIPNTENKLEVFFSNGKNKVITENIEDEIKLYAYKDEKIERDEKKNNKDLSKYKNVEKINLYYPFKELQTSANEDMNIVFIDTPGPNSTGDYGDEHKRKTREVLREVDMALFAFDYDQIDSNLKSDEQGLWHTIETRAKGDKDFEVYFLINKIDMAMNDNFKDIPKTDNRDEFNRLKRENWLKGEILAKEKVEKAAKNHGIENPKVYLVSSFYQLLERNDKKNEDDEDTLDIFKKKHFKRVFGENWEDKYINYLGIVKLEKDINNYINTTLNDNILKNRFRDIQDVMKDVYDSLNPVKQKLKECKSDKEKVEKDIHKALEYLKQDGEAEKLEKNMNLEFKKSSEEYILKINNTIDYTIKRELTDKVDEMSKIAIKYAEAIAIGRSHNNAVQTAIRMSKTINLLQKSITIPLKTDINTDSILKSMQNYMKSLFEDYKNNYLDIKTDLKNIFVDYEIEVSNIFWEVKDKLNQELQNALDIEMQSLEMQTVDIDSSLSFEVSIPDSILDYKYQKEEYYYKSNKSWWNPFSWFEDDSKVVTQEALHILTIKPLDLKQSIERSMNNTIESFVEQEKTNYENAIIGVIKDNSIIFNDFRNNKKKEINDLNNKLKNSEKELQLVEKQLEDFNNLTKE
ncbi:MAG: dynamin family protein [Aliarcobacter sp.]|jgi:predicted GTPase|nr:dynamin family protein [Aliarcobacter sp.]